jgi:tRNA dimethylallyltransferase
MVSMAGEIWLLGGVTASGKTELALSWAENNHAEILCCDSVSLYRGLDIGSAKPAQEELDRVPHFGLDLAEVSEVFDVVQFHAYARDVVRDIAQRGKKILVVGGSGFFLSGFLRAISDGIEVSQEVRQLIESQYQAEGLDSLLDDLKRFNPDGVQIDTRNPVRVIRALERCMETGKSLRLLQSEFEKLPAPYAQFKKYALWLDREDAELMDRIHSRAQKMVECGLLAETENALGQGIENHPSLSVAVGYREAIEHLKDPSHFSKIELIDSMTRSTRQLVSKQRKWFRKHFPAGSQHILKNTISFTHENLPWVRALDRGAGSN